jgi:phenylalanyl-tRNA synthetase beta chain
VTQDLAVIVPEERTAGAAVAAIRRAGGTLLEAVDLYDEYHGERVAAGSKGWTFALTYRAPDRTLTGEEAQRVQDAIAAALRDELDAELRR